MLEVRLFDTFRYKTMCFLLGREPYRLRRALLYSTRLRASTVAMPMIARRALPSRLTLVMRCTPTRDHICKKTHAHSPRQVAVAPSSPSPVGRSRAFPNTHGRTQWGGSSWLLRTRRTSASARRHKFPTKASVSGALSPAPPNRGLAGFDENVHATGASVHIMVCKA